MSVPAFTNTFVSGQRKDESDILTITRANGSVYTEARSHFVAYVRRTGKSKNKVTMVKGVPFRKPSSYRRMASIVSYEPGTRYRTSTGYTYSGVWTETNTERSQADAYLGNTGVVIESLGDVNATFSNHQAQADTECLLKLSDAKIQLGQFMAEAKLSANLVATSMINISELLLDIKHGRYERVRRRLGTPKSVANGLLQIQYGWRPLMQDLYSAYDITKNQLDQKAMMISAVREIKHTESIHGSTGSYPDISGEARCSNVCKIYARLSDSFIASANQIGVLNPVSLAWELVPYSFVVDWVMPIGNFLSSLSATAGLTFIGGYRGQRVESNIVAPSALGSGYTGSPCIRTMESFDYRRSAMSSFPGSSLYVKSPLSTSHVKTALALLTQLV